MNRKVWHGSVETVVREQRYAKGRRLNQAYIDKIVLEQAIEESNGTHGNFQCGLCCKYYGLSYGVYVRARRWLSVEEYICKGCFKMDAGRVYDKVVR